MTYKFTINGRLQCLNDYLKAERVSFSKGGKLNTKGNVLKHQSQDFIITQIRRDLRGLRITKPIKIHYRFYEPNMRRDLDNVMSFAMKVTQDSLVLAKVLENDGWNNIQGISAEFYVDASKPRIEVFLIEQE